MCERSGIPSCCGVPKTRKLLYDRYTNGHVPGYLLVRVSKTGEWVEVGSSISYGDNFWNT
jgi:hypothetical protein